MKRNRKAIIILSCIFIIVLLELLYAVYKPAPKAVVPTKTPVVQDGSSSSSTTTSTSPGENGSTNQTTTKTQTSTSNTPATPTPTPSPAPTPTLLKVGPLRIPIP